MARHILRHPLYDVGFLVCSVLPAPPAITPEKLRQVLGLHSSCRKQQTSPSLDFPTFYWASQSGTAASTGVQLQSTCHQFDSPNSDQLFRTRTSEDGLGNKCSSSATHACQLCQLQPTSHQFVSPNFDQIFSTSTSAAVVGNVVRVSAQECSAA